MHTSELTAGQPLLHICARSDWQRAQRDAAYRADSLATEGFIHCSTPAQVATTANRFYRGQAGLVLLVIDAARLQPPVRFEAADGSLFPHVYGPVNLDAVVAIHDFAPSPDGTFPAPHL